MKAFFSTLLGLIVIIVLAAVIIGFIFWSRVPDIVANNLSKKLNVPVQIDDIGLGWGKIDVKKVSIGNVPRGILPKAFSCNLIEVLSPFGRYLNRQIVIDEIDVSDVYLGLEFDSATSTKGNWTQIMKNLNSSVHDTDMRKKKEATNTSSSSARSVLIHRLILTNIKVDVVYRKDGGKVKHLPPIDRIELTEVSSEGGLPMDQIMHSVLGQMLKSVFEKENLKNMLQELLQQPGNEFQKYLQPFKGLLNAAPDELDEEVADSSTSES